MIFLCVWNDIIFYFEEKFIGIFDEKTFVGILLRVVEGQYSCEKSRIYIDLMWYIFMFIVNFRE